MFSEFSEKLVVEKRNGSVLSQNTILKIDLLPKGHETEKKKQKSLTIPFSGTKNFRKTEGLNIFGTSQPPLYGLNAIFNIVSTKSPTTFINLREEPVIYINKRPFVLRDHELPYKNLDYYQGIDTKRIESMEERLKIEILLEAKKYEGNIIIHDETAHSEIEANWESVNETTVQTPIEVFEEISKIYKNVKYFRIPITPEKSFSIETFDELFNHLKNMQKDENIIFNCQLGRTRSTMAMIICCLINLKSQNNSHHFEKIKIYDEKDPMSTFQKGEYLSIQNLILLLYSGKKSKQQVDSAIDKCSEIFNLREQIFHFKNKGDKSRTEEKTIYYGKSLKNLEFYSMLIAFNEFLEVYYEKNEKTSFLSWIKRIPEVYSLLKKISESNESILEASEEFYESSLQYTNVVQQRNGNLLSKNMILKVDHFIQQMNQFQYNIKGCPNFRKINSEISLYSSSTPNISSIDEIFDNFKHKKVVFINLRQEPHIYINGEIYCLRTIHSSFENIHFSGVKYKKVEKLENSLKEDIESELNIFKKKILIHDETEKKDLFERWIEVEDIKTSNDFFSNLKKEGFKIDYKRVPLSSFQEPTFHDIDGLLTVLHEIDFTNTEVVFFDQRGLSRCTLAMVIGSMFEKYTASEQYEMLSPRTSLVSDQFIQARAITSLTRTLPFATSIIFDVEKILDASTLGISELDLRKEFVGLLKLFESSRTDSTGKVFLHQASMKLKKYLILLLLSNYLAEQSLSDFNLKFSDWVSQYDDVVNLFSDIERYPEHLCSQPKIKDDPTDKVSMILSSRKGNVMGKRNMLKADHFPSCQRKSLLPHLEGAPNYRKVENVKGHIYGVAIPTLIGIKSVLDYISAKKNQVYWICLREEPVCYIDGIPYVLRDFDNPFTNITQTGISSERLEEMEDRLKGDILREAKKYNEKFLVHDEVEEISGLITEWKDATSKTILTPREVYQQIEKEGYKIKYFRVPVTDERAPEPKDFDDLLDIIKNVDIENTHLIYNCQMGRGRTTTGTIIASLVNNMRSNIKTALKTELEEQSYLNGNFKLINKLLRVLENANENKKEVDTVIDNSSQMQNLRTTILEFKLKGEKNHKELKRSVFYLERYFLLIVFNEYLMEQMKKTDDKFEWELFSDWLNNREEISNLLLSFDLE
eukprot:gene5741-9563_t